VELEAGPREEQAVAEPVVAVPAGSSRSLPPVTTRSYLICSTPRTGSYLLCDALTATGVAGRPTEYLMPSYRDHRMAQWGTATYSEYHEQVLVDGTTPNGVFGAKIHSGQFGDLLRQATGRPRLSMEEWSAVIEGLFPCPRYIWLRRRDHVGQAVSWAKACQTRIWWDTDTPPAPMVAPEPGALRFDFQFIERAMYSLTDWDGVWRTYFDATGIEPIVVWYEDMVADRQGTIAVLLSRLGLGQRANVHPGEPRFRRQSDDTSSAWADRFERLQRAKRESTLAALAGLHGGETIYVCLPGGSLDRVPRDAVTIVVDGAVSPEPASYALLTRGPVSNPAAGVVLATGDVAVNHPFVIRVLLDRRSPESPPRRNQLAVGADVTPANIAAALASHLGASNIEMV